ncbi:MAG: hypothetical protein U0625_08665 [Phycisphaerales bacterium]
MDCRFIRRAACAAIPLACAFAPLFLGARAGADLVFSYWVSSDTPGYWSQAARWSPAVVPNNGADVYDVLVDGGGKHSSTAYLDIATVIRKLQIDAGDTLQQLAGTYLGITGETLSNSGAYIMASNGYNTDLVFYADCTVGEGGSITTSNTNANRIYAHSAGIRITHGAGHTISGAFQLGLNQTLLTNHGVIDGSGSSGTLVDLLNAGPNFNDGTIRASNGGWLRIYAAPIQNTGGVLEATSGGALQLSDASITGGILRDADGAEGSSWLGTISTCSLDGVRIEGGFHCAAGTWTALSGSIDLAGPLFVDSNGYNTDLVVSTPEFDLGGTGGVLCTAVSANRIYGSPGTNRLTVPAGQSIAGGFQLGMNALQLTNHGTIDGTSSSGSFIDLLDAGTHFNDGTIRASNGGYLRIYPGSIQNAGGVIEGTGGGALQLHDCTIFGGVLRDGGGTGWTGVVSTGALVDTRIEGAFHCAAGTQTTVVTSLDLAGTLFVDSNGYNTDLLFGGVSCSIGGTGTIRCTNVASNRLYPNGASSVTIGSGVTIAGSFQIWNPSATLTNNGTILADTGSTAYIDPPNGGGFEFLNNGTIAAAGGSYYIYSGTFHNAGQVNIDPGYGITIESNWWQTAGKTTVNGSLTSYGSVVLDGGVLAGAGNVNAPVANNAGTVAPGNSPGILSTKDYAQGVAATLSVEIGGTSPGTGYDCLSVLGPASLSGTLSVARINGFVPTEGQVFTVLVCTGGRTGTFQSVQSCDNIELIYGANSVSLRFLGEYTRVADINHDGVVDGADLGLLLGGWGACVGTCCDGDLNGDGLVDGADLGVLLGNWG